MTEHHLLLLSIFWEHTHPAIATAKHSGQCPHACSLSLPRILQLGENCAAPPMWVKWDGVLFVWSTCCRGQTTAVITNSRGGQGPLLLGVPEEAPLPSPITSEEGIEIKHYLLLLSLSWKLTHPATATSKCSVHLINVPKAHYHFPGPCN